MCIFLAIQFAISIKLFDFIVAVKKYRQLFGSFVCVCVGVMDGFTINPVDPRCILIDVGDLHCCCSIEKGGGELFKVPREIFTDKIVHYVPDLVGIPPPPTHSKRVMVMGPPLLLKIAYNNFLWRAKGHKYRLAGFFGCCCCRFWLFL